MITAPSASLLLSNTIGIFLVALLLAGCEYVPQDSRPHGYQSYLTDCHDYEMRLPLRQSTVGEVKLYFDDVPFPKKEYITGGRLGVLKGDGFYAHSRILAQQLEQKARALGYDAVIDIEKRVEWKVGDGPWEYSFAEDGTRYPGDRNYTLLIGRGVKFVETFESSGSIRKGQRAYFVVGGDFRDSLFAKSYYPDGSFRTMLTYIEDGKRMHDDVVHAFDLTRLLYEERGWQYLQDDRGRLKARRRRRFDDWVVEEVLLRYREDNNHLARIIIKRAEGDEPSVFEVLLSYNDQSQLVKKLISDRTSTRWEEVLKYDDKGRHVRSVFSKPDNPLEQMVVEHSYYSSDELQALITETAGSAPINAGSP